MEYSFNTNIAKQFDVDIAIFLNNIKFWTLRNLANDKHIHDGLCWSYNTIPGFCKMFDFWSRHQIEHLIRKMKQLGLIATGNYNQSKYDRTCWYALTLKGLSLFPELCEDSYLAKLHASISEKSEMDKLNPAWCKNEEVDLGKFRDETLKIPRPIPDIKPDSKHTPIVPIPEKTQKKEPTGFEAFWAEYPVKKGKKKCEERWQRLNLDPQTSSIIEKLKQQIASDSQWERGFIPNPYSYINGSLWEDEISKAPKTTKNTKTEQKKYY